jgi:mRNA-degrading endonuclease toxin of MazEF toxin-antitoxin module
VPDVNPPRGFPRRGEIYWAPTDKTRPVLIVSADIRNQRSTSVVVVAITSQIPERQYPVDVLLPEGDPLPKAGCVKCDSLYTLLKADLGNYRDDLRTEQMDAVDAALKKALSLRP